DRLDDVLVAGAPAEIPLQAVADVLLARVRPVPHQIERAHHHARGAKSALQPVAGLEGGLHGMKTLTGSDALDGGDVLALDLGGEYVAALHGPPPHVYRAGAATGSVAADMRSRQAQMLAKERRQQCIGADLR